jgi:hypothetical protein
MKKIVSYHFIAWLLVILMGFHSALFALAFDKQKLLALDPLCSQRLLHQSNDFQNKRLWGDLGLGVALLGILYANSGGLNEDAKLGNLTQGFTLLTTGAILYYASGDPVVEKNTFQQLDLSGAEKEEVAYSVLKYNTARSKENRINSGRILMITGLGFALITSLAANASQTYKNGIYLSAAGFCFQGFQAYQYPGQLEKDMEKIDSEVGAPGD